MKNISIPINSCLLFSSSFVMFHILYCNCFVDIRNGVWTRKHVVKGSADHHFLSRSQRILFDPLFCATKHVKVEVSGS